ncbi:hypothetical protein A8C56_11665 [Niabella ginsenosidivorans]|uniref:Thioredoxin n=1 Tax=Niabella ginsenosidivorans TaxID=1176587 RepID=A0A1A9I4R2_9BACT|nr:thioredoxin family protein [Niabella ginsenosidivorans]ANH81544.1 hypothetical protein A8C56_11665 [Niabella ginsenosidivorans]
MKQFVIIIFSFFIMLGGRAQDLKTFNAYDPAADAEAGIAKAVAQAQKEHKHVLISIGGNWCIWCARFDHFSKTDSSIDSLIKSAYVVYHLNYSKENKNLPLLAKYAFPQRFGFPVFLVLASDGQLIHTQNSAYLEEGKGYSKEKVSGFLNDWAPDALKPEKYKE